MGCGDYLVGLGIPQQRYEVAIALIVGHLDVGLPQRLHLGPQLLDFPRLVEVAPVLKLEQFDVVDLPPPPPHPTPRK